MSNKQQPMNSCACAGHTRRHHYRQHCRSNLYELTAMNRALALTDHQLRQVWAAARTLLPLQRSNFLDGLATRSLGNKPTDEAVEQVMVTQLAINCSRSRVIQTLEQTNGTKIPNT
jgi:hypothetical protein